MCILLKLHYAKFGVSNLFFSKVIEEKPLGGRLDPPPLGIGRVNAIFVISIKMPNLTSFEKLPYE